MGRPASRRAVKLAVAAVLVAAAVAGLRPTPAAAAQPPIRLAAPLMYVMGLDPFSLSVAETPSREVYALVTGMDASHTVPDALYKVPLGIEGQDYVRIDRLTTAAQPRAGVLIDMDGDGLLEALVSAASEVRLYDWEGYKGVLQEVWSTPGTCDPILPGDFDEDGTLDFVGISAYGGTFSVYLGNGDGTFAAGQSHTYPISYMTAALGDFNGDGHDDIAVVPNDNDLYILRGDGAGQFATPLHVTEAYTLMGVDVADFNDDGKDDVVSAAGTNVAVLLGNGDCTFSGALLAVTDDLTRITACDWDGDGDDDAVGFTDDDEGWADVVLGMGNGSFSTSRPRHALGDTWVYSRAVYDVDHDGRQDVVTAGSLNGCLGVLYQGPDGTLGPRVQGLSGGAERVVVSDFDRDASPDLAATDRAPLAAVPLLWAGSWQFTSPGNLSLPFSPDRLAAADVDRDGRQDLVIGGDGSTEFGVALGNGNGGFAAPSVTTTASGVLGLAAGDFDRDGKVDLVTRESNALVVRAGDGMGGFSVQSTLNGVSGSGSDTDMALSDLDGDGCLDLAMCDFGSVRIFLGDGAGGLVAGDVVTPSGVWFRSVAVGDLDGDGIDDLVVSDMGDSDYLRWCPGLGDGHFGAEQYLGNAIAGLEVELADMDRDGRLDIVQLGLRDGHSSVSVYDCDDMVERKRWTYAVNAAANDIAVADFDGDELPDVVTLSDADVRMMRNTTDVPRGVGFGLARAEAGARPSDVTAGDLDRDGRAELAVANEGDGTVMVFDAGPDGLTPQSAVEGLSTPRALAFVDFNRDGRPDLAVAEPGATNGRLTVFGGLGDGTFAGASMATATLGPAVNELTATDVNRDGCPDLVVAVGTNVRVQRGNGTGGWLSGTTYTAGVAVAAVTAGDVDRDGDPDLVVADQGADTLVTLWNSSGTFSASVAVEAGRGPVDVALGDLDEDGVLDAVTADQGGGTVSVFQGTGTGFRQVDALEVGGAPSAIAFGDLDGDGLLDVTVKDGAGESGLLLLNRGRLSFEPVDEVRFGTGPAALAAGDFDRDGGCDVACANGDEGGLVMLARDVAAPVTSDDAVFSWVRLSASVHLLAEEGALGSGVSRVSYRVDGGPWTNVSGASATVTLRTWKRGGNTGTHKVEYYAVDVVGNTEDVRTCWILLDSRAPVTTDDSDGLPHATDVTVNLTATDAHSHVFATYYSLDGGDFVNGTSLEIVAPFNSGVHWIKYYSVDWAGNVESPRWCSVTIVPAGSIAKVRGPRLSSR